jgi:hypothetical protein
MLASSASAEIVFGDNDELPASGRIYIPLTPGSSGNLGDGGVVGLQQDRVTLTAADPTTAGVVNFLVSFPVRDGDDPLLPDGMWVDPVASLVSMTLRDMDFVPVTQRLVEYSETLQMVFVDDQQSPVGNPVLIDDTNWQNFVAGPPPATTNNQLIDYEITLFDFGIDTDAEAQAISLDQDNVQMLVSIGAQASYSGSYQARIYNTAENFDNLMNFGVAPEPTTLVMLLSGAGLAVLRRRRR